MICLIWNVLKQSNWFPEDKGQHIYTKATVNQLTDQLATAPSWDVSEETDQKKQGSQVESFHDQKKNSIDHHLWYTPVLKIRIKKNPYFYKRNWTSALMWSPNSAVHKLNIISKEYCIISLPS